MRSWIAKICLSLAVIIITAHNLVIHVHDHDHHDHGIFGLNLLDHSFITESFDNLHIAAIDIAPIPERISLPECISYPVLKSCYQLKHEYPPPQQCYAFAAFRAPPSLFS
jgi:hypothetical protein